MPRAASARRALRSRLDTDDIPPRPDRAPPHVLNWSHEITPELDVDWTLCPEDPAKELRLREERNVLIKEQLQLGKPVVYRSSGWPLYPRVWSNDLCSYDPVTSANEVRFGDIVFLPGPAWRPLLRTRRVAQVVRERRVVLQNFEFEREGKRLVRHEAHIRPIDPMPALICTTLRNLCAFGLRTIALSRKRKRFVFASSSSPSPLASSSSPSSSSSPDPPCVTCDTSSPV